MVDLRSEDRRFTTETQRAQSREKDGEDRTQFFSPFSVFVSSLCPLCLCGESGFVFSLPAYSGNGFPFVSGSSHTSTSPTANSPLSAVTAAGRPPAHAFRSPDSHRIGAASSRPPLKHTPAPVARSRSGNSSGKYTAYPAWMPSVKNP